MEYEWCSLQAVDGDEFWNLFSRIELLEDLGSIFWMGITQKLWGPVYYCDHCREGARINPQRRGGAFINCTRIG